MRWVLAAAAVAALTACNTYDPTTRYYQGSSSYDQFNQDIAVCHNQATISNSVTSPYYRVMDSCMAMKGYAKQ